MTISTTVRKAGPYLPSDYTTVFPFGFKVFDVSDLVVIQTDALGAETTLVYPTDYTVSLNADQDNNPGGTITKVVALSVGKLTITSEVPEKQLAGLSNVGAYYPKVVERALDRLTILVQQLSEKVARAVKVNISSGTDPDDLIATITTSASAATAASATAVAAAADAVAAASNLPNAETAGADKILVSNTSGTGWLYKTAAQFLAFLGLLTTSNTWNAVQKTTPTTDNDLTVDLAAVMDVVCTPTAGGTLSFTNIAAGVKGEMLFINGGNYAITKGANIKCPSALFATLSTTGRYLLAFRCLDGTNVDLDISQAHT